MMRICQIWAGIIRTGETWTFRYGQSTVRKHLCVLNQYFLSEESVTGF